MPNAYIFFYLERHDHPKSHSTLGIGVPPGRHSTQNYLFILRAKLEIINIFCIEVYRACAVENHYYYRHNEKLFFFSFQTLISNFASNTFLPKINVAPEKLVVEPSTNKNDGGISLIHQCGSGNINLN